MLVVAAVFLTALVPLAAATTPAAASQHSTSAAAPGSSASSAATSVRPMTLDGWNAGNIISDAVFTNSATMNESQIQAFLNAKVPVCQSGYTCLKDFRQSTVDRPADRYCNGYVGAASEPASRIIARAAQSCGINPQVLVVMLQKEQGLVTHTWPSNWRYDAALGQGCPDDAPCNPDYVGFFFQIYGAARQMKIYMEGRYFTWYAPGNTWNILYNPNQNCGSAPVYIANAATAALYYYTPYQPNAAALRAGYGEGDACSAYGNRNFYNYFTDWFGSTQSNPGADNPIGNVELVQATPGNFSVAGWALDPNTSASLAVHVYVGSVGKAITADLDRPDVAAAYPSAGSKHGFAATVPATGPGDTNVCVYAINQGPGANVLLGCKSVTALSGDPVGKLDAVSSTKGTLQIGGWALDPDTTGAIAVHVYVDSTGKPLVADQARTDIPAAYRDYGTKHGFTTTVTAAAGTHNVCAYGINSGPGGNVLLGCVSVTVTGTGTVDPGRVPVGNFEGVSGVAGAINVGGWAFDPDTTAPISVHIYVDSASAAYRADKSRPDVAAAYPAMGANHGFAEKITATAGNHNVCVYAINDGAGGNVLLGCRTVVVTPVGDPGSVPFGNFESVSGTQGAVRVDGWAIDPDTADPISIHIYVDSASAAYTADKSRPDVGAAFPASGPNHGFSQTIPASPGSHTVCVYAINNGMGGNAALGCKSVTVPAPPTADPGRVPFGNFESATAAAGAIDVSGWVIDPDTADPISVHIYVDSASAAYSAGKTRTDVGAAYPASGPNHGFAERIAAASGTHNVCVYAINNGAGGNVMLGCRSVVVP